MRTQWKVTHTMQTQHPRGEFIIMERWRERERGRERDGKRESRSVHTSWREREEVCLVDNHQDTLSPNNVV